MVKSAAEAAADAASAADAAAREEATALHRPDDWEFETAFTGPAPMANRWFITTHNATVRLGFCEQYNVAHIPQFRGAITLDHHDALAFAETLLEFLRRRDQAIYGDNEPIDPIVEAETAAASSTGVHPTLHPDGLLSRILGDGLIPKKPRG